MAKNNDNKKTNSRYEKSEQSGNKKPKEQIKKLPAMQKKNSHRAKAMQKASEQQVKIDLAELETVKKSTKGDAAKKTAKLETAKKYVDWYFEQGLTGIFAVCQSSEIFFLSLDGNALGSLLPHFTIGRDLIGAFLPVAPAAVLAALIG